MIMARNFIESYGQSTLEELIADWHESELDRRSHAWANFPPDEFLEFCRSYPRTPFDSIPASPNHLKEPSFLISQAHRLWVTTSLIYKKLTAANANDFLDLGSFPFFTPLILRDYFGFTGNITATANLPLGTESLAFLDKKRINIELLDLDPFVADPTQAINRLPATLHETGATFDLVSSSHVIEHLYHPRSMLLEAHRLLREGGEIIVTTDNAMMLDVLLNYISGYGYIFEPVENTAAMHFDFWRGHVRFFSERDLTTMLGRCGFGSCEVDYFQCFYDVFFPDYFRRFAPRLQNFRAKMLAETPWLRNDIAIIAKKG